MKDRALRLVDRYWFIVIVFLSVAVLPRLAIEYVSWTGGDELRLEFAELSIDASNAIRKTGTWTEYVRHHVAWQVSSILYLLAALGVIVLSTAYIWELRGKARFVLLAIVAVLVLNAARQIVEGPPVLLVQHLSEALFTPPWATKHHFLFGVISATRLDDAITMSQCFTSAAFIFFGFAVLAILSWRPNRDFEVAIDQIVAQRARMRMLLFAGSATLFIGVVAIHSLVEWREMLQCVFSEQLSLRDCRSSEIIIIERREVADAGATILMLWTIAWTMVLAALYIPARLVLAWRIESLYKRARSQLEGLTRHEWIEKHGLRVTYAELMVRLVAILGPLVTGRGFSLLAS